MNTPLQSLVPEMFVVSDDRQLWPLGLWRTKPGFRLCVLLVWVCCLLAPSLLQAKDLIVEGAAAFSGHGVAEARRLALEDALWQASAQLGAEIQGETLFGASDVLHEHITLRTRAQIPGYRVLDEWQDQDLYWVRILVDTQTASCGIRSPARIGAIQFPLRYPAQQQAPGLHGLELGVPNEILHRLSLDPNLLPYRAEVRSLFELKPDLPNLRAATIRDRVQTIAREMEIDYLLAGMIVDVGWENIGRLMHRFRRQAEVEVYLFDGVSGELLLQRRASREAKGSVVFNDSVAFGSQRFYQSDYGETFTWVLDQLSRDLRQRLVCSP